MKRKIIIILLFLVALSPVVAWGLVKQVRIFLPQYVSGITCISAHICIDDKARGKEAKSLYKEALLFVNRSVGMINKQPRIIFCSSQSCFEAFGFKRAAAQAIGTYGIIVGPRSWKHYFIRHEMIHHLQAEKLGVFWQMRSPVWLVEGMAYTLSEDPRTQLWGRYQGDRTKFKKWYAAIGRTKLWSAARKF